MNPECPSPADRRRVLGVFGKQPRPGQVKSRLAAETSPEWAAAVALAFLRDLIDRLSPLAARRVLVYAPEESRDFFQGLAGGRFDLSPQQPGDLGQRLAGFCRAQLEAGAERVVLIGADSPTLPVSFLERAFEELGRADVVLGPAADGGYYLIGCAHRLPPVFEGVAWGTGHVLAQTVARLPENYRLALLPPWYDVDTLEGWRALRGHVAALRRAGLDPGIPCTEKLLGEAGSPGPGVA